MPRLLLSCVLLLAVATTSAAGQAEDVAARFVAGLTANNIAAFDGLAAGDATDAEGLAALRDSFERYGCIQVAGYRTTTLTPNRILVEVDATASTHGRNHNRRTPFPAAWVIDFACSGGCRITSAVRAETYAARELMSRPASEWRSCPVDVPVVDEAFFMRELSFHTELAGPARKRAFDFVLERAAATGNPTVQANCLYGIGFVQRGWGETETLATLRKGLDLARRAGNVDDIAAGHFYVGTTLWFTGRFREGLEGLREASAMIDVLDDPRTALKALAMRTFISQQLGDLRAALLAGNELIAASRRFDWPQGEAAAGLYLGNVHASMGDVAGASFYFHHALRKANEIREGRLIAMALETCATIEGQSRHYGAAIALIRRSIDSYGETLGPEILFLYVRLSSYLRQAGKLAEARTTLERARALQGPDTDPQLSASIFFEDSQLRQAEGDLHGALDSALRGIDLAMKKSVMFSSFSSAEIRVQAARIQTALGHDSEAIAAFRQAITALESDRAAYAGSAVPSELFMETAADAYRTLVGLLVRRGQVREAFEYSERMRGRALGDVLAQAKIDLSASMTAAERSKEQQLERAAEDPALPAAKREDARAALARFETELVLIHPALRTRRPLNADFRPRMPAKLAHDVVVEYVVAPSRTIVFAVTASGIRAHFIPVSQEEIERRVNALTSAIARRDYGYAAAAKSLYTLLLEPVAGELRGRSAVCIVPDGALWRVPFQALLDDDGRWLIESAAVSYAPSLATLRLALERRQRLERRPATIAAIGNSTVVEADREVRTIAALYGRSKLEIGPAATPQRFRRDAADASVLHIAAHAVIDDAAPMYSALMLAPDKHNDGALEARSIANLSLNAHTAVLSACETAGGRIAGGEGIIGLSWAFLLAGCPTTVASQWQTSSASTATVMIDFHRRLSAGADPSESLRQAELALLRDPRYRHPFYWAAFVVMGAP